jgi:hypothetical protein
MRQKIPPAILKSNGADIAVVCALQQLGFRCFDVDC